MVAPAFNSSPQRQREVDLCDLEVILVDVEHSRTAVLRYCLNKTINNNNNTEYLSAKPVMVAHNYNPSKRKGQKF